jgi:hypothetical protein
MLLAIPLRHLPPMLDIGHRVRQDVQILHGYLPCPVQLCNLTLKEGNLPGKVFNIFMRRASCCGVLHLHCRHPLLSLPLRTLLCRSFFPPLGHLCLQHRCVHATLGKKLHKQIQEGMRGLEGSHRPKDNFSSLFSD